MYRIFILLIFLTYTCPSYAEFHTFNNNSFNSKLRMNKPNVTVSDYRNNIQNYHNHSCPTCHSNGNYYRQSKRPIPKSALKKLEKHVWGKHFSNENEHSRLERLEEMAFGAVQSGDLNSRYQNVESALLSRPKYKTRDNIISTLGNMVFGQPTGFTPNITPQELNGYDQFAPFGGDYFVPGYRGLSSYGNNMVEHYSNGLFGGGWGSFHNSTGSGSGVHFLD